MILGIQYAEPLLLEHIADAGFSYAEIPYEILEEHKLPVYKKQEQDGKILQVSGLCYPLAKTTPEKMYEILSAAKDYQANYIVLETIGCQEEQFTGLVEECCSMISDFGIPVLLENGMLGDDVNGYLHSVYSDARNLVEFARFGNRLCDRPLIGICINIGYLNILAKNVQSQLEQCSRYLCAVHVNDNDGTYNSMQMPYTFTQGRGTLTTNWPHIIGALIRMEYNGWLVFDTRGLFRNSPVELQVQFMRMLWRIALTWQEQFAFEEKILNQPKKKLILFGAGKMASNYMEIFGEKYRPAFIVDNVEARWGTECCGIPVYNPQEILQVPKEERNVLICCMYYNEIGAQLRQMGVEYHEFIDHYYL